MMLTLRPGGLFLQTNTQRQVVAIQANIQAIFKLCAHYYHRQTRSPGL
jgi:hypothetical protein